MNVHGAPRHIAVRIERTAGGTVRVDAGADGAWTISSVSGDTWDVRCSDGSMLGTIQRGPEGVGGFVLIEEADGPSERARTTPLSGPGHGPCETTLLTGEGRAFRIGPSYEAPHGVRVSGWECRGAYFEGTFADDVWVFRSTLAGEASGLDPDIVVLLAAELFVDGERE